MLRVFLFLTCIISITWLALLFVGPTILKSLIYSYSNSQLIASNIKVTPKLDVKVGRLDYELRGSDKNVYAQGFSRSVNLLWSVFGDGPLIEIQAGPTFFKDDLLADSMNLSTAKLEDIDLDNILLNLKIENLKFQQLSNEKVSLSLNGFYNRELGLITELQGVLPSFSFSPNDSWTTGDIIAKLNELDLNVPVHEQNLIIEISSDNILNKQRGISLSNLEASVGIYGVDIDFRIAAQGLELRKLGHSFGDVNVEGKYNMEEYLLNADVQLSNNSIINGVFNFPELKIDISNYEPGIYEFGIVGDFEPFDLSVDGNFIGKFPAGDFGIDLRLNSANSEVYAVPKFTFNNEGAPTVSGAGDIIVKMERAVSIFGCMLKPCEVSKLHSEYKFYFTNEWVSGTSSCNKAPCDFYSLSHSLKTSNTAELFALINQSAMFNPVYAFYFYNVVIAGDKVGNGHKINLINH